MKDNTPNNSAQKQINPKTKASTIEEAVNTSHINQWDLLSILPGPESRGVVIDDIKKHCKTFKLYDHNLEDLLTSMTSEGLLSLDVIPYNGENINYYRLSKESLILLNAKFKLYN